MKRIYLIMMILFVVVLVSCNKSSASSSPGVSGNIPESIKDWIINAPEDVIIGIGTSRESDINLARTNASTRARADIASKFETVVTIKNNEITETFSNVTLIGVVNVLEEIDEFGNYWVVAKLSKSSVVDEINQAAAAAKLAVPAMASFDAEERMKAAFDKAYGSDNP